MKENEEVYEREATELNTLQPVWVSGVLGMLNDICRNVQGCG